MSTIEAGIGVQGEAIDAKLETSIKFANLDPNLMTEIPKSVYTQDLLSKLDAILDPNFYQRYFLFAGSTSCCATGTCE